MLGFDKFEGLLQELDKQKIVKYCLYTNKLFDIKLDVLEKLLGVRTLHTKKV